ncbi:hypothetical protein B0H16DRAFT_1721456 [Mycena metata]|uniref:Ubiquitin-like domain-containing protein n=1 Tax=Mycena metata TaxID=1033252 RepID=A0AAD7J7V0_9AGAR|nr:hypothetical protein B0H16DRAFT_1721456 [Mycena metata]
MSTVPTILNVRRRAQGRESAKTTIKVDLPLDTPFEELAKTIQPLVDLNLPAGIASRVSLSQISPNILRRVDYFRVSPERPFNIVLTVTTGASTYDSSGPEGFKINLDEPLAKYYKDYRRHHGYAPAPQSSSESSVRNASTLAVGPAKFAFNRTLRVPDDKKRYPLPPGLGTPTGSGRRLRRQSSRLYQDAWRLHNGIPPLAFPLFQREALWMSIKGSDCAIKLSVGGINAITGGKRDEKPPHGVQDYVVGGLKQLWVDGIATKPGVVRQFVAMKLGYGYTIEEQLSSTTDGGIQIDVFPSLTAQVAFSRLPKWMEMELDRSPRQLTIDVDEKIVMAIRKLPPMETLRDMVRFSTAEPVLAVLYRDAGEPEPGPGIFVKTLTGEIYTILGLEPFDTIYDLKLRVIEEDKKGGLSPANLRLIFSAKQLEDGRTLADYGIQPGDTIHFVLRLFSGDPDAVERMGIAAGGKIEQKIYVDIHSPVIYDEENPSRVFIHTVSTAAWEAITGVVCPVTSITPKLYKAYNYPWFALYEEDVPAIRSSGAGVFKKLRSIGRLVDTPRPSIPSGDVIDPQSPPDCPRHPARKATCVARPCAHPACSECHAESLGSKCKVCAQKVAVFIGFKKRVPGGNGGGGSEGNWVEDEAQINSVRKGSLRVVTLMLKEDSVTGLHGARLH